ncbi:MAG: hypothetical protein AB8I08_12385 [Sandaracinaceae bacterium]
MSRLDEPTAECSTRWATGLLAPCSFALCSSVLCSSVLCFLALSSVTASAQERGLVVTGRPDADGWIREASRQSPGAWEAAAPSERPEVGEGAAAAPLADARRAYRAADFEACGSALSGQEARLTGLLVAGERAAAGRAVYLAAGCAVGLGDTTAATAAIRRAFIAGLDGELAGADLVDEHRRVVQERLVELAREPRVALTLEVVPADAAVAIDGRERACERGRCEVEVPPGPHVVVVRHPQYARVVSSLSLDRARTERVELPPVSTQAARARLQAELADGLRIDLPTLRRWADAYQASLVLAVDQERVALYDAAVDSRYGPVVPTSIDESLRTLLAERRGPTPIEEEPAFWVGIALGLIAVTAAIVVPAVVLTAPREVAFFPGLEGR